MAGCAAPLDPDRPGQPLYSKIVGRDFDGYARHYYDKYPGGNPTVPGTLHWPRATTSSSRAVKHRLACVAARMAHQLPVSTLPPSARALALL